MINREIIWEVRWGRCFLAVALVIVTTFLSTMIMALASALIVGLDEAKIEELFARFGGNWFDILVILIFIVAIAVAARWAARGTKSPALHGVIVGFLTGLVSSLLRWPLDLLDSVLFLLAVLAGWSGGIVLLGRINTRISEDNRGRSTARVAILSSVTIGIYAFYLIYQWAREINRIVGRVKYGPRAMLAISIATVGLGGVIIECLYAHEIQIHSEREKVPTRTRSFSIVVAVLNALAVVLSLTERLWLIILAFVCGIAASTLIQRELNIIYAAGQQKSAA